MKHLRTLLALAFASMLATSAAFAEGDKKPEDKAKKEKSCCCCSAEKAADKKCGCCTGEKAKPEKKEKSDKKD
jgi:hypothetical protein